MNETPSKSTSKGRSPRYPALSLEVAIGRAQEIFRHEGKNALPPEVAARHWHISAKSSTLLTTMAALRSYGLIDDSRTATTAGKVILTDLGMKLAADDKRVNPDRARLLREAALKPVIYAEVLKKYPDGLPSDDLLMYYLRTEKGFTAEGVRTFIRYFRANLRFTGLAPDGNLTEDDSTLETPPEGDSRAHDQPIVHRRSIVEPAGGGRVIQPPFVEHGVRVPVARGEWATINGVFPMPRAKWDKFLEMLAAMEFALVTDEEPEEAAGADT
jgi:hypothetical protein